MEQDKAKEYAREICKSLVGRAKLTINYDYSALPIELREAIFEEVKNILLGEEKEKST